MCLFLQVQQHHLVAVAVHVSMSRSGDQIESLEPSSCFLLNGCDLFNSDVKSETASKHAESMKT